jgi:hypothetical protein
MEKETFCVACMRHLPMSHFTIWLQDKDKSRRCNSCHDCKNVKERILKAEQEREQKPDLVRPLLKNLSKLEASQRKLQVRRRIEELNELKKIEEEYEL